MPEYSTVQYSTVQYSYLCIFYARSILSPDPSFIKDVSARLSNVPAIRVSVSPMETSAAQF